MKATKIRAYLVAPALAAVLGLGAHMAFSDTITPSGSFTAPLCSGTKVTISLGTATVTCTTSSTGGTVPSSTGAGTPVCGGVNTPTLSGCTVRAGFFSFGATCTAAGSWNLCVTPTTATLTGGTVSCSANILGQTCTAASSPVTLNGTWSNANSSATFSSQPVTVTTSGGFPCPSGSSASFSASYCSNPHLTVSDP